MIEASFDRRSRDTAISGVYQYDTGQRLKMHGLPSPDELLERDDLLSGNSVTVEVQFGYMGDTQTESSLAIWDEDRWAWIAPIPDAYLTRSEAVHVYVSVFYGADEDDSRNKTMYEGAFTPISRPAPNTTVTEEQIEDWDALKGEIEIALTAVDAAVTSTQTQAAAADAAAVTAQMSKNTANTAARNARNATSELEAIGAEYARIAIRTRTLSAGSSATFTLSEENGVKVIDVGVPKGAQGAKGTTGDTGPSDITLTVSGTTLTITPKT